MSELLTGDSVRVPSGLRGVRPIGLVTYIEKRTGLAHVTIVTGERAGKTVTIDPAELKRYRWPSA